MVSEASDNAEDRIHHRWYVKLVLMGTEWLMVVGRGGEAMDQRRVKR